MITPEEARKLYLEHLDLINRLIDHLSRRNGFTNEEAEDFNSAFQVKLIDRDYAVIREFKGASSLKAFLATVAANFLRDYRNKEMGKWRPSKAARQMGPLAIRLERLTHRDGYRFKEAYALLKTNHGLTESERDLALIHEKLPTRVRRTLLGDKAFETMADSGSDADNRLVAQEREKRYQTAVAALDNALQELDPEERVLVHMHYREEASVASIARSLGKDKRKLYRRLESIRNRIKLRLGEVGIIEVGFEEFLE